MMMDSLSLLTNKTSIGYNDFMSMEYHIIRDLVKSTIKTIEQDQKFWLRLFGYKTK